MAEGSRISHIDISPNIYIYKKSQLLGRQHFVPIEVFLGTISKSTVLKNRPLTSLNVEFNFYKPVNIDSPNGVYITI